MELARLGYCGATRITILRMVSEGCWAEAWVLRVCYFVAPLSPIPRWFGRARFWAVLRPVSTALSTRRLLIG
jgi:hypothetical protein